MAKRMIKRAVRFAKLSGFQKRDIHVISARNATCSYFSFPTDPKAKLEDDVAEVHAADPKSSFTELHNLIRNLALERKASSYLWLHADVLIAPKGELAAGERSFRDAVFADLESLRKSKEKWGAIFYAYDWFAGFNLDFAKQEDLLMWDESLFHYGADCDMYYRFHRVGQKTLGKDYPGVKIMHMYDKPEIDDRSLPTAATDAVAWAEKGGAFTTDKKETGGKKYAFGLTGKEQSEYEAQAKESWRAYVRKWGTSDCNIANLERGSKYCENGGTGWTNEQMSKCTKHPVQKKVQGVSEKAPGEFFEPFADKTDAYWNTLLKATS